MTAKVTLMKLIDAIKHSGRPFEIPDASRNDLPQFFKEMGYKVGVEIGVWYGEFGEILAKEGLKVYGVDSYTHYDDFPEFRKSETMTEIYEQALKRLAPYDYTIIKKTSMEAVKDFANESIDFVYIDGNHSFKYVTEDIWEWSKKVKKGGIVTGHDYVCLKDFHQMDVKYVIDAYTQALRIPKWYVLGRKYPEKGEKRDRHRSWMWIK